MKIDRLVSIILILIDKKRISAKELADTFEVSIRTIYRDIDAINMAGIPVYAIPGVNGGFSILPNYKVDKNVFSAAELSTILIALSSANNIIQNKDTISAVEKIKSLIPNDKASDIEFKANQIYVDFSPWIGNKAIKDNLDIIKAALNNRTKLSVEYINHSGTISKRIIEPYQLMLKNNSWYLIGYCYNRLDFRVFKLVKIIKIENTFESFIPREYKTPKTDFSNDNISITYIKLKVDTSILEQVLEYTSFNNVNKIDNNSYIVDFPFIDNDYFYNILLGFGDKCECIEPINVREKLKKKIENLYILYK